MKGQLKQLSPVLPPTLHMKESLWKLFPVSVSSSVRDRTSEMVNTGSMKADTLSFSSTCFPKSLACQWTLTNHLRDRWMKLDK